MFCFLKIIERENTLIEKLFGRFRKDEYELKTVPVFKGAPFYKLCVTVGKKGVNWQEVRNFVGKCANRLLVNDSVVLDKNWGVGKYNSPALYSKLVQNSFVNILKKQNKIFETLCFIDKKAQASDHLFKLVPCFAHIVVVTDNKRKYEKVCEKILDDTGLCVTMQNEIVASTVKIDADRNVMTIIGKRNIYIFSDGEEFSVPEVYEKLYDDSVDRLLFYSALYEFCGVFELAELSFDTITINGEKKGINELILT